MLDTDTASYIFQGGHRYLDLRLKHTDVDQLCISVVSAAELLFGVKAPARSHPRQLKISGFLDLANILPWDMSAAQTYADVRYTLTTIGKIIGELDMMIAAHALATGSILVSNNTRHFERLVPALQLENWTEP